MSNRMNLNTILTSRISRLYHEPFDNPVEYMSIEVAISSVSAEVFHSTRDVFSKQTDVNIS